MYPFLSPPEIGVTRPIDEVSGSLTDVSCFEGILNFYLELL